MSRFSGWNMAAIERLQGKHFVITEQNYSKDIPDGKPKVKISYDAMSNKIANALRSLGIDCRTEYKFLHDRRFRIDVAIVKDKIAIEFEGGIYSGGAHTRGKGYAKDCKKYNLLMMHGWKLLRYSTADTKKDNWEFGVALDVKKLLQEIK